MLVCGESLSAQRKYGQPFCLHPFARLLFSANSFPRADNASEAFMRRWIVIPFSRIFEGPSKDPHLPEKLNTPEVLSALLVKAVRGLRSLKARGEFVECVSVTKKVEEYRVENDSAYEFSLEMLRADKPTSMIPKKDVLG